MRETTTLSIFKIGSKRSYFELDDVSNNSGLETPAKTNQKRVTTWTGTSETLKPATAFYILWQHNMSAAQKRHTFSESSEVPKGSKSCRKSRFVARGSSVGQNTGTTQQPSGWDSLRTKSLPTLTSGENLVAQQIVGLSVLLLASVQEGGGGERTRTRGRRNRRQKEEQKRWGRGEEENKKGAGRRVRGVG